MLINITAILTFAIFSKPSEHIVSNAERVLCLDVFLKEKNPPRRFLGMYGFSIFVFYVIINGANL